MLGNFLLLILSRLRVLFGAYITVQDRLDCTVELEDMQILHTANDCQKPELLGTTEITQTLFSETQTDEVYRWVKFFGAVVQRQPGNC